MMDFVPLIFGTYAPSRLVHSRVTLGVTRQEVGILILEILAGVLVSPPSDTTAVPAPVCPRLCFVCSGWSVPCVSILLTLTQIKSSQSSFYL